MKALKLTYNPGCCVHVGVRLRPAGEGVTSCARPKQRGIGRAWLGALIVVGSLTLASNCGEWFPWLNVIGVAMLFLIITLGLASPAPNRKRHDR